MNMLLLNATTSESDKVIVGLEGKGWSVTVANSFRTAINEILRSQPDLIVIDATLEFGSTDALFYIRNLYDGSVAAFGYDVSTATRDFLSHLGVAFVPRSVEALLDSIPAVEHPDTDFKVA